ncbi:excitatory amino acid transporter 5 [Manacus vitellinus]|uniref:excitatory amino acid transporter 5 n=1 Tax=Manacus vitellinus TaxID=328815 RepID=UPI0004EFE6F8|nr:excitatory amino acid transporter 5 [Manacus vitellinus]XP_051666758.1 excitatory amino acid transporter 5-like [Manacus candei]
MWECVRRAVLHSLSTVLLRLWKWLRAFWYKNGLLTLSMLSVATGCLLGFLLRTLELTDLEKQYFSFPGELLMRMLKMLILPLITSSLMSGLATMDSKACGKMGVITITYYLWTTFLAVTVGIILVVSIHPGAAAQKDNDTVGKVVLSSADALLDLIRNMFPSNLVEASFQQYRTVLVPVVKSPGSPEVPGKPVNFIYFAPDDQNPEIHRPVFLELTPSPEMTYRTLAGTSNEMNVLGIVIFSATIGLLLGKMGERGAPLVNVCQCLNEAVMKIVSMAVWYFPFGIVFLIAGKILEMEDPSVIGQKLGLYVITVVSGLAVHGLVILPLLFVLITKKNPFAFIQGILQALLIALATSSSSATLPITLKCLLENNGIDRRVARFVLPVGATINMDGTALYEAVAAIFIAQVNEYELDLGQIITISITASAASIGAAGIPQSGLVTMVIVLTSVGLPTEDITLIIAVDWALDRLRTMTNVLGDALAAGIIAHVCEKDFAPKPPPQKPVNNIDKLPSTETSHPHPKGNVIEMMEETLVDPTGVHYSICQV